MEIPVYLFTGFLESGKTSFIRDLLNDPNFAEGERTLLFLCEEGEEELDKVDCAFEIAVAGAAGGKQHLRHLD